MKLIVDETQRDQLLIEEENSSSVSLITNIAVYNNSILFGFERDKRFPDEKVNALPEDFEVVHNSTNQIEYHQPILNVHTHGLHRF